MVEIMQTDDEYKIWLSELKKHIHKIQIKAAIAVNKELLHLYWHLGEKIVEKQNKTVWGGGFLNQLSKDLKKEFPDSSGFSVSNLKYCRQFYKFYSEILKANKLLAF